MKNLSRLLVTAVFLFSISNLSCKKNETQSETMQAKDGVLTGFDQGTCPCCGGLMINFNNETKPYTGTYYLIDNDTSAFGISDTSSFPIYVKAEYTIVEKCSGTHITVTKLTRR